MLAGGSLAICVWLCTGFPRLSPEKLLVLCRKRRLRTESTGVFILKMNNSPIIKLILISLTSFLAMQHLKNVPQFSLTHPSFHGSLLGLCLPGEQSSCPILTGALLPSAFLLMQGDGVPGGSLTLMLPCIQLQGLRRH